MQREGEALPSQKVLSAADCLSHLTCILAELFQTHPSQEDQTASCSYQGRWVQVEEFATEASFDGSVLLNLNELSQLRERTFMLVTWKGCLPLRSEGIFEGILQDGEHVERNWNEDVGFRWMESRPNISVAKHLNVGTPTLLLIQLQRFR